MSTESSGSSAGSDQPLTVTATAAAEALGISRWTVYRLCEAKALPAVKVGRQWRVFAAGVRSLLTPARDGAGA